MERVELKEHGYVLSSQALARDVFKTDVYDRVNWSTNTVLVFPKKVLGVTWTFLGELLRLVAERREYLGVGGSLEYEATPQLAEQIKEVAKANGAIIRITSAE